MYVFFFPRGWLVHEAVLAGWLRLSERHTSEVVHNHVAPSVLIGVFTAVIKLRGEVQPSRCGARCAAAWVVGLWWRLIAFFWCAGSLRLTLSVWCATAAGLLFEVVTERRGCFHASALAGSLESLCGDDSFLAIKVGLGATLSASKTVPFLPKCVAVVPWMLTSVGLVDAWAGNEELKCFFIDSFVDVEAALQAFEIAGGFSILMLLGARRCLMLLCEQVLDDLCPRGLLDRKCRWCHGGLAGFLK